jgi:hypothetical protein
MTTKSLWQIEHRETYDPRIEAIMLRLGFEESSWHNDMSASFRYPVEIPGKGPGEIRLWIDHWDALKRESPLNCYCQLDLQLDSQDNLSSQEFDLFESALFRTVKMLNLYAPTTKPQEEEVTDTLDYLTDLYALFRIRIGRWDLGSADEHLNDFDVGFEARIWLADFVKRWERAQEAEPTGPLWVKVRHEKPLQPMPMQIRNEDISRLLLLTAT